MSLKLGNFTLRHGLQLAPMAGAGDASFRILCRAYGAEYCVSEMLSAKALCYEQLCKKPVGAATVKTASLARITPEESPCAIQIFGHEPEYMARAASLLESGDYRGADDGRLLPAAIDINMGCPVHKVVAAGEGSALMKNIPLAADIVSAVAKATKLPVTVKMRAGWNEQSKNAVELARAAEASGAAAICLHARTRDQFYSPGIDLSIIEAVKSAVSIPVIGNGDITSAEDAIKMLRETGCDGVAVGRGALGNPWIFREIAAALDGKEFTPPTPLERVKTALSHAEDMLTRKGERAGLAEARPHIAWYTKGIRGAASARNDVMSASSLEEIGDILYRLIDC